MEEKKDWKVKENEIVKKNMRKYESRRIMKMNKGKRKWNEVKKDKEGRQDKWGEEKKEEWKK